MTDLKFGYGEGSDMTQAFVFKRSGLILCIDS